MKKAVEGEPAADRFFDGATGHWKAAHRPKAFGPEAYDPIRAKEFNTILLACMKKLPAVWSAVFNMKHIEGYATEIICKELAITPSNFWVIIHRTKVNLRACLQKTWL